MPILQIEVSADTHKALKEKAKANSKLFRPYVRELLERSIKASSQATKAVATIDPDLEAVLKRFDELIGDHTTLKTQVTYAQQLLKKHGVEQVLKAIEAASQANGQQYAPSIGSLKQLNEKWISLKSFWQKTMVKQVTRGVKIR